MIKFRAWDKVEKKMCYVDAIWFRSNIALLRSGTFRFERLFNRVEFMQITGLADINGVEIYEGDIVKNVYDEIYLVKWLDAGFYLEERYNGGFDYSELHFGDNKEIISNIYENPELLEGN